MGLEARRDDGVGLCIFLHSNSFGGRSPFPEGLILPVEVERPMPSGGDAAVTAGVATAAIEDKRLILLEGVTKHLGIQIPSSMQGFPHVLSLFADPIVPCLVF